MPSADELRQALKVAELEERLVHAKQSGPAPMDLKLELRAARQALREMRAERPVEPGDAQSGVITTEAI